MSYIRVLPRDLFNEAKLLKCLGQLSLHIHDHNPLTRLYGMALRHYTSITDGFTIDLDAANNALCVHNLSLESSVGHIHLYSVYNSKAPYPLQFTLQSGACGAVFCDNGNFDQEFIDALREESNR